MYSESVSPGHLRTVRTGVRPITVRDVRAIRLTELRLELGSLFVERARETYEVYLVIVHGNYLVRNVFCVRREGNDVVVMV